MVAFAEDCMRRLHALQCVSVVLIGLLVCGTRAQPLVCGDSDTPLSGQSGTRVTITGTNLLGVSNGAEITEVTLAGVPAEILEGRSSNDTIIVSARSGKYMDERLLQDYVCQVVPSIHANYAEEDGVKIFPKIFCLIQLRSIFTLILHYYIQE